MHRIIKTIKQLFLKSDEVEEKKYVLRILSEHEDGGFSSRLHKWSGSPYFTYREALKEKEILDKVMYELTISGMYKVVNVEIEEV